MITDPTALVVEDDAYLALIFSTALRDAGFTVTSAVNGKRALGELEDKTPNVILLDLHLPDINGTEILGMLRENKRFADTQIILATADPLLADTYHEQADMVLIKPVSYVQLRDLARRLR